MYWINFLHIYQPSDQTNDILERVTNESYRPLFKGLLGLEGIKINLNINGSLTELLAKKGYQDVIDNIRTLAETGRLEFTESAKYHCLLPFLKKEEIIRQIKKNNKTNRKYFGPSYKPSCVFPPEMAYSPYVGKIISEMGYPLILIDEIAYSGGKRIPPTNKLFTIKNTKNLTVVFRERRVSNSIMSAVIQNKKDFTRLIEEEIKDHKYLCTAMDGETFGHHRPGLESTLFEIMKSKKPEQIFFSEVLDRFRKEEKVDPLPSTWASAAEDIDQGVQFYSWKDPKNKVHGLQWKLFDHLIATAKEKKLSPSIQDKLDRSMASDQFFWASGEPWWSIEMIEKGAWAILDALKSLPNISESDIGKGEKYYKEIISSAFWWQRGGRIESLSRKYRENVKMPFKERTVGEGKPEVYYAFIKTMEDKMKEAAKKRNYERAILWRDAIWKLETKNDIYDAIHAVDLLRLEVTDPYLKNLMDKYKEKYEKLKPGQPEKRKA